MDIARIIGLAFGAVIAVFLLALLLSLPMAAIIMWCWNYLAITLFNLPTLNFLQAWCIVIIVLLVFGSTKGTSRQEE